MTTHDHQIAVDPATNVEPEFSSARTETAETQTEPAAQSDPALAEPAQTKTEPHSAEAQTSDEELLFAADLSGLRSRWDDIQAAFVDDPADCVQKADTLVTEVVEQLTTAFSEARSRLEAQWARGEQASTEDLRLALTRYREFFQRLLAV
jgi:predicted lipid-binding transport protein (Tim44 family)